MNKLLTIAAAAVLSVSGLALAGDLANPWANDGAQVKLTVTVSPIAELWSTIGTNQSRNGAAPVALTVDNAGGRIAATGGKVSDTISYLSNVAIQAKVSLQGNIPEWTRLHIIVKPTNAYNCAPDVDHSFAGSVPAIADKVITWRHQGGSTYAGYQPGDAVQAFTGAASTASTQVPVDYAMDSVDGMPALNSGMDSTIVWTIATNP